MIGTSILKPAPMMGAISQSGRACLPDLAGIPCPTVLGQPCRQAVHRRETPGINLIGRIKQLAWAVGVLECLPLPSRARWAQAAENRIGGCLPRGFTAVTRNSVGAGEGSVAWLRVPKVHIGAAAAKLLPSLANLPVTGLRANTLTRFES